MKEPTMSTPNTATSDWSAVADAWDANADEVEYQSAEAVAALLERIGIRHGDRVLELASGPGSLGVTLSLLAGPTGHVVLSDLAPGMVEVATRRNASLDNVTVEILDASAIDRPDAWFDVVVCRMGLMFTLEPDRAFAEIYRVLEPGGRFGALTWAGMELNPWMTCVGMAAMMHGLVTTGPPVGPGAIFSLSDADRLKTLADSAGFLDVAVQDVAIAFRAESIETHITRVSSLAGPLAGSFAAASAEQLAAVRRTATDLAQPYVTADGVEIPGCGLLVSGRHPG
jgi:ubiquinone/menaquinone biosynthesis C-methylase UbiE